MRLLAPLAASTAQVLRGSSSSFTGSSLLAVNNALVPRRELVCTPVCMGRWVCCKALVWRIVPVPVPHSTPR